MKKITLHRLLLYAFLLLVVLLSSGRNIIASALPRGETKIIDTSYYSNVFGELRNYRIFLPPGYNDHDMKRYPVIYFFHGWSQRYFGPVGDDYSNYDQGSDNGGDNIANFVRDHDVIVIKPDGFNPSPDNTYELHPYNECWVTTWRQFPLSFVELVDNTDNNFRTVPMREERAVCGLSMGGFFSFWLAGKYPDMIAAAGDFCGSSEFMAGPLTMPVEYRILDHYRNYDGVKLRFNYGKTDNLRFFHFDMDKVWREVLDNYKFVAYDAAHSTCGLSDMFNFCLNTFKDPLPKPERWNHTDIYPEFSVWRYNVSSDRFRPGFTILENVGADGFRSAVREFMPDGALMKEVSLMVTTDYIYGKDKPYIITDLDPLTGKTSKSTLKSDLYGRLKIRVSGGLHEIGINKPDGGPVTGLASAKVTNMDWAVNRQDVELSLRLYNKGITTASNVTATLTPVREYVKMKKGQAFFGKIEPGKISTSSSSFVFRTERDSIEIVRFRLVIKDSDKHEWSELIEIPMHPGAPEFTDFEIADGRMMTVTKAGVLSETVMLGKGNGDGIANPGESIVLVVKDRGKFWRTWLYTSDTLENPLGENSRSRDFWDQFDGISSSPKISVPLISSRCPAGHELVFSAEYWVPDNKFHVIKRGVVKLKVTGEDKTAPAVTWANISGSNRLQVHICEGAALKHVRARLIPVTDVKGVEDMDLKDPGISGEFELNDKGLNGDVTVNDHVFSAIITPPTTYFYKVRIESADEYGNASTWTGDESFLVHVR